MSLGMGEIALLIILALVLFGAKRLPEVGRAAGDAIREFKSALSKAGDPQEPQNTRHMEPIESSEGKGDGARPS